MPNYVKFLAIIFLVLSIAMMVITIQKCGAKTFFLGNGATYAAMSGMCD